MRESGLTQCRLLHSGATPQGQALLAVGPKHPLPGEVEVPFISLEKQSNPGSAAHCWLGKSWTRSEPPFSHLLNGAA